MRGKMLANGPYCDTMDRFEKNFLEGALQATYGDMKKTAQVLGIGRNFLYHRCAHLKIDIDRFRPEGYKPRGRHAGTRRVQP